MPAIRNCAPWRGSRSTRCSKVFFPILERSFSHWKSYANANRYAWQASHNRTPLIEALAGFTFLLGDTSPPGVTMQTRVDAFKNGPMGSMFHTIYAKAHAKGGHFAAWENPDAMIEDIRQTFRGLRS